MKHDVTSNRSIANAPTLLPAIVVVAYNRAQALSRLLYSLSLAELPITTKLVISLEGNATPDVRNIAEAYSSEKFEKRVVQHQQQLGLRNHILTCGSLAHQYGSIIVLEDDLVVDRHFYQYASEAATYYSKEPSIAGIALYSQRYNEYAGLPFHPMENGSSTYPMQLACSWGQCWTSQQWLGFEKWYSQADNKLVHSTVGLPDAVKSWPENSWKKYFSSYLIYSNKSIIYPYRAYTTNCSDPGGTNNVHGSNILQVNFASQCRPTDRFSFCPPVNPDIAYDAYMEPSGSNIFQSIGMTPENTEIDTLGIKPQSLIQRKPYVLTRRHVAKRMQAYPRQFRPVEYNFYYSTSSVDHVFFSLTEPKFVSHYKRVKPTLSDYAYYGDMDLNSLWVRLSLLTSTPRLVLQRIRNALAK